MVFVYPHSTCDVDRETGRPVSIELLIGQGQKTNLRLQATPTTRLLHTHHEYGVEGGPEWCMHDGDLKTAHMPFFPFFPFSAVKVV